MLMGCPRKPRPWRLAAAAGAAAVLALAGWAFRASHPDSRAVPAFRPGAAPRIVGTARQREYQTNRYMELLGLLRGKLSGSGGEVRAALAGIAQNRPELAIDLARALGRTDGEKTAWVEEIVRQWAGRDPSAAWNWLARPGNPLATAAMVGDVLDALAAEDPAALRGLGWMRPWCRRPDPSALGRRRAWCPWACWP